MSIEIDINCEYCGKPLSAAYRIQGGHKTIIEVEPCETCLAREREEGAEEGAEEARKEQP